MTQLHCMGETMALYIDSDFKNNIQIGKRYKVTFVGALGIPIELSGPLVLVDIEGTRGIYIHICDDKTGIMWKIPVDDGRRYLKAVEEVGE